MSLTCVLEKDEAAIESSEYNATSVADVDKRVKRRLLMGNTFLPLPLLCSHFCLYVCGGEVLFWSHLVLVSFGFGLAWFFFKLTSSVWKGHQFC